ncbi:hypothetical protein CPB83DRAFT_303133 [Crepidotus variabilis]|uniref:Uncharacterized protein n=1 Tax=Crepidotus variabilis TaxID=179855 RepID=A0A9P6EGP8_9AGAR|nr:hypothetical protein CPB83DRAFT_303133 [Crepidotus variabilis]
MDEATRLRCADDRGSTSGLRRCSFCPFYEHLLRSRHSGDSDNPGMICVGVGITLGTMKVRLKPGYGQVSTTSNEVASLLTVLSKCRGVNNTLSSDLIVSML